MEKKRKERKISYSLSLDGYFLMIWIFLGSGRDIYSIHFGPTCLIQSTLVLYKSFWSTSVLFNPLLSYLVYFGLIQSIRSHFGPIRSYLVHSIFIWSISVLFGPLYPLPSYSVKFGPIWSTSILFESLQSIFVHLSNGKRQVWIEISYSKPKSIKKNIDGLFV